MRATTPVVSNLNCTWPGAGKPRAGAARAAILYAAESANSFSDVAGGWYSSDIGRMLLVCSTAAMTIRGASESESFAVGAFSSTKMSTRSCARSGWPTRGDVNLGWCAPSSVDPRDGRSAKNSHKALTDQQVIKFVSRVTNALGGETRASLRISQHVRAEGGHAGSG